MFFKHINEVINLGFSSFCLTLTFLCITVKQLLNLKLFLIEIILREFPKTLCAAEL